MPEAGNHEREREDIVDHDGGIPAYGKIHALGSRFVEDIFKQGKVIVQEKVDGSQFSFAKLNGRLRIRSKGREIFQEAPDSLFKPGVEYVQSIEAALVPGWIYRAEYLRVPKHNALTYSRIPRNHIALFDVLVDRETYLDHAGIVEQADILRVEAVPELCVFTGHIEASTFLELLKTESFLGGQTIEGVVVKNYNMYCSQTGHCLMAKYVSEAFKEVHRREWGDANPSGKDVVQRIIEAYRTPARWEKAVYRLRDEGKLEGTPRDIGGLIKSVWPDIVEECQEDIKDELWKHFSKQISRGVVAGLPEWYKQRLLHQQFEDGPDYGDGSDAEGFPGGDRRTAGPFEINEEGRMIVDGRQGTNGN